MRKSEQSIISALEKICLFILGVLLLVFPLVFLSTTTDAFTLPKQMLLITGVSLTVVLFGLKSVFEGKIRLRSSPFDLAVFLLLLVSLLSAVFSLNRADALAAFVPFLFVGLLYFAFTNIVKNQQQLLFILSCLVLGAILPAVVSSLAFFHVYLLPFSYTHSQFFNTFGSLLDQAIYFGLVLPITGYFAYNLIAVNLRSKRSAGAASPFQSSELQQKSQVNSTNFVFTLAFIIIAIAFVITVSMLFTSQKPALLPFDIGLQTGFAAISQDSTGILKSFLLGSGIGTFVTDFNRFKSAVYNTNSTLWSLTFFRSSSYLLELLATTGVLGLVAYLFLIYKSLKTSRTFVPLLLAIIVSILLPFSFTITALFFIILAIAAVTHMQNHPDKHEEVEFYFVALKRGLFALRPEGERITQNPAERRYSRFLPIIFLLLLLVIVGVPLFFSVRYFVSDMTFQNSLIA